MKALEEAMAEIEQARSDVAHSDVRTELESITASLQEMLDTEAGEQTDAEVAFGDTDFSGAAPHADHLLELEKNLVKLAENTDQQGVGAHLETAHRKIANYRTEKRDGE